MRLTKTMIRFFVMVWVFNSNLASAQVGQIMTVNGAIAPADMGTSLVHEHVFLDWTGAERMNPRLWKNEEAFKVILPHLKKCQALGVKTFMDCTPNFIGRNPLLLKKLADSTGLQIMTNTGYYGAVNNKYLPAMAFKTSARHLSRIWIREFRKGIGKTGIRPGFIKIGVNGDSVLSPMHEKLIRAAALTHLKTGLTIVAHTGPYAPARQQVNIVSEMGLDPSAWVWTHAQGGNSTEHEDLARRGAWISLDGLGWVHPMDHNGDSTDLKKYVRQIVYLKHKDLLSKLLISHDAGWFTHSMPGGGKFMPFTTIFELVIPLLKKEGFSQEDFDQLLVKNPQGAFTLSVRKAHQGKSTSLTSLTR
jgi:phosphotriesterase-related protein